MQSTGADDIVASASSKEIPDVYRALVAHAIQNTAAAPALQTLVRTMGLPKLGGLHATDAHNALLQELASKALRLSEDGFNTKGDVASRTLLGPRGIGKSTTLRSFAAVAPLVFPNVIPLYISYIGETAHTVPLMDVVAAALRANGVRVQKDSVDGIASALDSCDKYVMLLVDEIDKLYEAPLPPWYKHVLSASWHIPAVQTLQSLAHIGDHTSGRFSTLLCGSSGLLTELITMNAATNADAVKLFPLLSRGLNINGSKFKELHLHYGSSVCLSNVGAIFGAGTDAQQWSDATRRKVKLYTFVTGTTARALDEIAQHNKTVTPNTIEALYVGGAEAARRTLLLKKTAAVWDAVMKKLWRKNLELMESLVDHDYEPKIEAIASIDWNDRFLPLDNDDKKELCLLIDMDDEDFHMRLVHLYDHDWIAFGDSTALVFPRSLWSLSRFMRALHKRARDGGPSKGAESLATSITMFNKDLTKQVITGVA
jgi:hypothetical protein